MTSQSKKKSPKNKDIDVAGPRWVRRILSTRLGALGTNWVFQGMRYMQWHELAVKFSFEALVFGGLYGLVGEPLTWPLGIGLLALAHTINWLVNGHFFVLTRYVFPVPTALPKFEEYVARLEGLGAKHGAIDGLAVYGSYCRDALHEFSDLDVRVISKPGAIGGLRAALFCFGQRLVAIVRCFPLDIYSFTSISYLDRLRPDEKPVVLIDKTGQLANKYSATGFTIWNANHTAGEKP